MAPATGSMEELRRVTRCLLGKRKAKVKQLVLKSNGPLLVDLKGYSDSDWAGDPLMRTSQRSGHIEADGCP